MVKEVHDPVTGELSPLDHKGRRMNERGQELPDPVPMEPPLGYKKQPSMVDIIRAQVRQEVSRRAQMAGYESFDEADDFEVEDFDPEPQAPYEAEFEPVSALRAKAAVAAKEAEIAANAVKVAEAAEKAQGAPQAQEKAKGAPQAQKGTEAAGD